MSKLIQDSGTYNVKDTGEQITYSFEYVKYDNFDELVDQVGKAKVATDAQRQIVTDARNTSREKAKAENGHSSRTVLSEEQKQVNKAKRAEDKVLLDAIKSNPDLIKELLGK